MLSRKPVLLVVLPAIASPLLGYLVSVRVANAALNVQTSLLLLASVSAAVFAVAELALVLLKPPAAKRMDVRVVVVTSIALLFGLDLFLRYAVGRHVGYLERNDEHRVYRPLYSGKGPTWFQLYSPNIEYAHYRPEFRFPRKTNSLGLPELEMPPEKRANEYRILALGDSYTEGVGTAYEQTWIKEVERRLGGRAGARTVAAFNAGVSGSDPWYEFMLLKEKLLSYRPDLVIVAINRSDFDDVMMRGGPERFLPDGTTLYARQSQSWEWLYGLSYIVRLVVHDVLGHDHRFIGRGEQKAAAEKAIGQIEAAVTAFVQLGRERGFRTIVVLHPEDWEAARQQWSHEFAPLVARLRKRTDVDLVDVLEVWKSKGLLDNRAAAGMYWPIDHHNNSKGYAAIGEVVAARILELNVLDGK